MERDENGVKNRSEKVKKGEGYESKGLTLVQYGKDGVECPLISPARLITGITGRQRVKIRLGVTLLLEYISFPHDRLG